MTYPHPNKKNNYINKKWLKLFLNWKQKGKWNSCIFSIVSCSMYAVCQLFPPRFGSFVHSSLQIFRCFIKHNTKKYFFKLCQNLHISQPIFVWTVPLYVVPYYPELYTVIYSTIILRCLKDAVNFAWLFGNYTKSECFITNLWAKHVLFENFITKDSRCEIIRALFILPMIRWEWCENGFLEKQNSNKDLFSHQNKSFKDTCGAIWQVLCWRIFFVYVWYTIMIKVTK